MESILSLVQAYQAGDPDACTKILQRMAPLAKKYASKIHCMEYEDALQELYVALIETLDYLNSSLSEGKCVKYMETAVVNRYYTLCKRYLSLPDTEDIDSCSSTLPASPSYDDTLLDIEAYIKSLPQTGSKRQIFSMFFYEDMSDNDIAAKLNVSRQYVNRVKKQLIREYFSK